jgi:hypothetical protein
MAAVGRDGAGGWGWGEWGQRPGAIGPPVLAGGVCTGSAPSSPGGCGQPHACSAQRLTQQVA